MAELAELRRRLKHVEREPQSPTREDAVVVLKLEIHALEAKLDARVNERALLLYRAWKKNGVMTVMLPNGQQVTERPVFGGSTIQHIWNARSSALWLARLSYGA